jgi:hypothetical protein
MLKAKPDSQSELEVWRFNPLFAKYSLEDAMQKAVEMERERANWSQLPLLKEIYSPGWKEWKNMPGAQLVEDLMEWENGANKDHEGDPWYPKYYNCGYIWKGEVTHDQYRQIELSHVPPLSNNRLGQSYSLVNAISQGFREISDLAAWWTFDEETHEIMFLYSIKKHFGFTEEQLARPINEMQWKLKSEERQKIDKNFVKTANKFVALRDGPALLVGANMLMEMENPWTNRKLAVALPKHYGLTNDEIPQVNVHTYIDIFHTNIGRYILGKYAGTKDDEELIKAFYQGQKQKQWKASEEYYEKLNRGDSMKDYVGTVDGNIM